MVDSTHLGERIGAIRRETIALLDRLDAQTRSQDLPEPPPGLLEIRHKLVADTYTVLVAGEAKRGKSTFVNALIIPQAHVATWKGVTL